MIVSQTQKMLVDFVPRKSALKEWLHKVRCVSEAIESEDEYNLVAGPIRPYRIQSVKKEMESP